jgi:hypothetical protein
MTKYVVSLRAVRGLIWIAAGTALAVSLAGPVRACDEPGTPNREKATAMGPTAIRLDWVNTASEKHIYFDIEGKTDRSKANFGPFQGLGRQVSFVMTGLTPNQQHCFRMWARTGADGCRSQLPSAWACAVTHRR